MTKEIKLTQGKVAIVDDEDYEWLNKRKWHYINVGYAARRVTIGYKESKIVCMHREIIGAQPKELVDHRNGQTLDNRRENLRIATHKENIRNMFKKKKSNSGFRGVTSRTDSRHIAQITVNGQGYYIGTFPTSEEAAKAYDKHAIKYFGEFAHLNFP